jgi:hypothetical protein
VPQIECHAFCRNEAGANLSALQPGKISNSIWRENVAALTQCGSLWSGARNQQSLLLESAFEIPSQLASKSNQHYHYYKLFVLFHSQSACVFREQSDLAGVCHCIKCSLDGEFAKTHNYSAKVENCQSPLRDASVSFMLIAGCTQQITFSGLPYLYG